MAGFWQEQVTTNENIERALARINVRGKQSLCRTIAYNDDLSPTQRDINTIVCLAVLKTVSYSFAFLYE